MPVYGIYRMILEVVGHDQTGNIFHRITSGLASILQYATAIVGAMVFERIASGIGAVVSQSVQAVAWMQQLDLAISALVAREMVQTGAAASVGEAWEGATQQAEGLIDRLQEIAILSPYTVESVSQTYKMAMAFGYTTDEAMTFTQALLENAAGIGADNSMLDRMAYNLAQVRLQGKVTALDIRQLALAGFDLVSVLKYTGKQMGVNIEDHLDFNEAIKSGKITWKDFTNSFAKYAEENFGGATERMARSLYGLKSTFHDVFVLTMPKVLGPAAESVTVFLNEILDKFISFRQSGQLEIWAGGIQKWVERVLDALRLFMNTDMDIEDKFANLIEAIWPEADGNKIVSRITSVWNTITGIWNWGVNVTSEIVENLKDVWAGLQTFWDQNGAAITAAVAKVFGGIGDELAGEDQSWIDLLFAPIEGFIDWMTDNGPRITGVITGIADFFATYLLPAITKVITFLSDNWQSIVLFFAAFKTGSGILGAIFSVLRVVAVVIAALTSPIGLVLGFIALLATAWIQNWGNIQGIVGKVWAWLQPILETNIPIAIEWLSNIWTGTLLPAIQTVWGWLSTTFIPWLSGTLWPWLSTTIPTAIQTLSTFWTGTLLPALTTVWGFITSVVIPYATMVASIIGTVFTVAVGALTAAWNFLLPVLTVVWNFVATYLMPIWNAVSDFFSSVIGTAINIASTFFTNVLLPAIRGAWDITANYVMPILRDLIDIFGLIAGIVGRVFAAFWDKVLLPPLKLVYAEFNEHILPILKAVSDFIREKIGPAITWFLTDVINPFVSTLQGGLKNALSWFHDILLKIKDFFAGFELPAWLQTGSPTPFELGLRGINAELAYMADVSIPGVKSALRGVSSVGPLFGDVSAASMGGSVSVIVNIDNIGNDVDADRLAHKIAQTIQRKRSYG